MRQIKPIGGAWAYTAWLLPDGSTRIVYLKQAEYEEFHIDRKGEGEAPGKPSDDAKFLMGVGGIPVFNTPDGRPHRGDFWKHDGEIIVFTGEEPTWGYKLEVADEPKDGRSRILGFEVSHENHVTVRSLLDVTKLPLPIKRQNVIDAYIPNHKSVTFDASSISNQSFGTSMSVSHTTTSNADRYMLTGTMLRQGAVSTVTYNSVSMTGRTTNTVDPYSGEVNIRIWDLIAPTNGANTILASWTGNKAGHMATITGYGADQTTGFSNTASNTGTNTSPTVTVTSATGELVFTMMGWYAQGITSTPDGSWTALTQGNPSLFAGAQGAYKAGAATVTRTDTLSGTPTGWVMQGVSMKAAAGAAAAIPPKPHSMQPFLAQ